MDTRTRSIQTQSNPPYAGTEHLIDDALSGLNRDRVFADGPQITTNEEAAAEWLIALRHARYQLQANGTLATHALDEIKAKGWIVLAWRPWNAAQTLHERKTAAQQARRKWAKKHPDYPAIVQAAKRLLAAGTHPRNLVSKLKQTAIGAEYSEEWLCTLLQRWQLLPRKKVKLNYRR